MPRTVLRHATAAFTVALGLALPAAAADGSGATRIASNSSLEAPADADSWGAALSADGRHVAFTSDATTLVPGDSNGKRDAFVKDLVDGSIEIVSLDEEGRQRAGNSYPQAISADGRYVLVVTLELVPTPDGPRLAAYTYLRDRSERSVRPLEVRAPDGRSWGVGPGGAMSGNGRYYVFATTLAFADADTNDDVDLYRLEIPTGSVQLVSTGIASGDYRETRWPAISHSGRWVAFEFTAPLVRGDRLRARDIYVRDMTKRRPTLVTRSSAGIQANRGSMAPGISAGGRYVVYSSYATNLAPGDTNDDWDVFLHDRRTRTTERVSLNSRGRQGNRQSQGAAFWGDAASVSRDGRYVVFGSVATNLSSASSDEVVNVFLRDRRRGTTRALSLTPAGTGADGDSGGVVVSDDGSAAAWWSHASNLVDDDANGATSDVFVQRLHH